LSAKFARLFVAVNVVIVPDRDKAGESGAAKTASVLRGHAASIKVAVLPTEFKPTHGDDVRDVLRRPAGRELLMQAIADATEPQPQIAGKADSGRCISNYEEYEDETPEGEIVKKCKPISMGDIIDEINRLTDGWPRRVDSVLFVDDKKHGLDWFDRRTTAGLFGWLRRHFDVRWKAGGGFVGQAELFAELERTSPRYDAIELLPHEPPIDRIYYRQEAPPPGDGKALGWLLDRFRPETTVDRDLIQSVLMTAFWGGPVGCRPAFVITADAGRGTGKTKLAEMLALVAGGFIDISAGEDIATIKQRFLSPGGQEKRIALLDNVKSLRFSWAELEALITNPVISGKRMYVGEGQRPNVLTWLITLNGVSLAADMAQRSVIIKLASGDNTGPWEEDTKKFIAENHRELIGDIVAALRNERFPLEKFTRWATWEKDILSRLPEPGEAQRLIAERQQIANYDRDEADTIEDFFAEQLMKLHYDSRTAQVRIPIQVASRWLGWATGETMKTIGASRKLRQMIDEGQLQRLSVDTSRTHGRNFIWTGERADLLRERIENDLQSRLNVLKAA
jgi:hypothetical protein